MGMLSRALFERELAFFSRAPRREYLERGGGGGGAVRQVFIINRRSRLRIEVKVFETKV